MKISRLVRREGMVPDGFLENSAGCLKNPLFFTDPESERWWTMKVNVYPSTAVSMFDRVIEKNADQRGGSHSGSGQQKKKDSEQNQEFEATVEAIQKAVDDFSSNDMNVSHGISATQEGTGPGLKVTLRDSSGGVLRSVSGEEFLRLREAIQAGAKSGRILDQKV